MTNEQKIDESVKFIILWTATVLKQLVIDKLLFDSKLATPREISNKEREYLFEALQKYSPPTYPVMATYGIKLIERVNPSNKIKEDDLLKLFETVEVNNGYIL